MSTNNPHSFDPLQPQIPRSNGLSSGWIIAIAVAVLAIPVFLACAGIVVGLTLPAVQAAREAARRMQCSNNLKQIALALHNYESTYKSFPPAYTVDSNGKPLHSWRTLILPFMEQQNLYKQIDLSKPWDDPANARFSKVVIPFYQCPSANLQPATTTYVAVVDPQGIFSGPTGCTIAQIKDGTSNTLLVAETDVSQAVPWMAPQDIDRASFINVGTAPSSHTGGANSSMADGSVHFLSNNANAQIRTSMLTKDASD